MTVHYAPLRAQLIQERQRVEELIEAENKKRSALTDTGDHEHYGNHPGDEGSETFEKEQSLALQGNLQVILDEVDQALHKMDVGSYGRCDECGAEIPYERLEVRPQATLCIACKSKVEHVAYVHHMEQVKSVA